MGSMGLANAHGPCKALNVRQTSSPYATTHLKPRHKALNRHAESGLQSRVSVIRHVRTSGAITRAGLTGGTTRYHADTKTFMRLASRGEGDSA